MCIFQQKIYPMKQIQFLHLQENFLKISLKKLIYPIAILLLSSCSQTQNTGPQIIDLTGLWDSIRPLENPDKGWYHHMLDNGVGKYLLQDENDLKSFPGMDHLYLRLAWAYLEPEEGEFDWSYIDDIVEKYLPQGYKFSFRISCKETGPAPTSVPEEIDGILYASPYWVRLAGAKGIDRPEYGSPSWTPDWDNPVFLEKLDNFHRAFAEKYDGKPWLRYIDVGSIGDWGEGHTWSSTRVAPGAQEIMTHMQLYLKHYKSAQLVVTDDLLYQVNDEEKREELFDYAIEKGFTFRDDSPMVKGTTKDHLDTWSVRSPEFFEKVYQSRPTIFELEHYGKVKENGYWLGRNGAEIIPEFNVSGAKIFREAMKLIHPTYIGYHGYMGDWLRDNPELTVEFLNFCGYWYFPVSLTVVQSKNRNLSFMIEWLNKGLAPAYAEYQLKGKLIPDDTLKESVEFEIENSGNKNWMPGQAVQEKYKIKLAQKLKGNYHLAIQLYDTKSGIPVEIGLSESIEEEGFFLIAVMSF